MRIVRLAEEKDIDDIQKIYNHKDNREFLGGFTMRDPIVAKVAAGSEIVVEDDGEIIGADQCGFDHSHRWRHQLVGVYPEFKRQRVATSMYVFSMIKAMLSGRLFMHDYIISDNCIMPLLLPTLGYNLEATQRSKVRRHKDMGHWVKEMSKASFAESFKRVPDSYLFDLKDEDKYLANVENIINQPYANDIVNQVKENRKFALEFLKDND
jgi:hypothetical protein